MRNLTLGVLIVTGGALAALPFRRYQVMYDANDQPGGATGPTFSALDDPPPASTSLVRSDVDLPLPSSLPIWHRDARARPAPRRMDVPLSFDDLMTPIDMPQPIRDRFTATSEVHSGELDRQRSAILEMPPIESMMPSMQDELERKLASQLDVSPPLPPRQDASAPHGVTGAHGVSGSLASSPWYAPTPDRLPKPSTPVDDRQWIRQP